jgi:hypothetical protein
MTKRFGPGKCVYCLGEFHELTSDHIIPESWYPTTKPAGLELPQAPACLKCNAEYGVLERGLRELLGFAVDPWTEGGEGIGDKSLRSIDPSKGRNERDRAIRARNQEVFAQNIEYIREPGTTRVLPNIGRVEPDEQGFYRSSRVPKRVLAKVIRKWVRGFAWYCEGKYLGREYVVQAKTVGEDPSKVKAGWWAPEVRIGPGVIILRKVTPDHPVVGLYIFRLWGRFEFLGAVVTMEGVQRQATEIVKMQLRWR